MALRVLLHLLLLGGSAVPLFPSPACEDVWRAARAAPDALAQLLLRLRPRQHACEGCLRALSSTRGCALRAVGVDITLRRDEPLALHPCRLHLLSLLPACLHPTREQLHTLMRLPRPCAAPVPGPVTRSGTWTVRALPLSCTPRAGLHRSAGGRPCTTQQPLTPDSAARSCAEVPRGCQAARCRAHAPAAGGPLGDARPASRRSSSFPTTSIPRLSTCTDLIPVSTCPFLAHPLASPCPPRRASRCRQQGPPARRSVPSRTPSGSAAPVPAAPRRSHIPST
jgi:hypothetical protein